MDDLNNRIANLSPAKRGLLAKLLGDKFIDPSQAQSIKRRGAGDMHPPLSFAQERLWFLGQLEPDSYVYNIPIAIRLTGPLDVAALERSFNEIVSRHEILRTTFDTVHGQPVQVIAPDFCPVLQVVDMRAVAEGVREAQARQLGVEEARRPFDLVRGPLLRTSLLWLDEQDYVLLLTLHHIISDAWSTGILIREMVACYEAFSQGRPSPLSDLPIQYADFAAWQREWLQDEVLESQLSYWKRHLKDVPPVLELPIARPRSAINSSEGSTEVITLAKPLSDSLKRLSQREGVTLFVTLLAAFKVLLYRYTNQEDIAVGTPIANRQRVEIEGLIGFFVNTLLMRADLSGNPSFRQLLERVREVALGAYAHQDLPFERLVEALQPERSLSHTPLFQVMFVMQNAPARALEVSGLRLRPFDVESGAAKFDLIFSLAEEAGGLVAAMEYSTELFDADAIKRMLGHFHTLLEGVCENPDERISSLPLLTEGERQQILKEWNDTAADYPLTSCIHHLFERQVERSPEAIAVTTEGQQLSYDELNRSANRLARRLVSMGVKPGLIVGVCVERSPELVIGLLGVLKTGGVYLPLDPTYPPERIAYMMKDARVEVLLTLQRHLGDLPADTPATVIALDLEREDLARERDDDLSSRVNAGDTAYVIYTSGSTGKPKGVCVSHGVAANHFCAIQDAFGLEENDHVLQFASLSFDVSLEQILPTLLKGGRVVLQSAEGWSTAQFYKRLSEFQLSVINLPPAYWHQLSQEATGSQELSTAQLKLVIIGGDVMSPGTVESWQASSLGSARLLNAYGPTEAAITSVVFEVPPRFRDDPYQKRIPIGRPLANRSLYILDQNGVAVPAGVPGELHIGGSLLSQGYLNRPEITAERFVPDPFSEDAGARLYKTGDLARYLPCGNIEFLGRIDDQIKLRGFRIELGEIESVLGQHPAVRAAAVAVYEGANGGGQLVGYIVPDTVEPPSSIELRSFLQKKLPDYMSPSSFVLLDALPLTPNGKVDRRALPAPGRDRKQADGLSLLPRDPIEDVLAGIWARVLGINHISINDNFFDLGGHSLLATQVISQIRESFKVELPLRTLFENPTVAALSRSVRLFLNSNQPLQAPALEAVRRADKLPLSFAQERLWFFDQFEPGGMMYNLAMPLRLIGELNVSALEQSLEQIIRRHEVLRTRFETVEGEPVQVIEEWKWEGMRKIDLSEMEQEAREMEATRLATEEAQRPFDLVRGPLLRASLVRLDEQHHVALLSMHHIISDGWSMSVLVDEVSTLYEAYSTGKPHSLEELPVQYADYAAWQREWLQGEVLEAELSYWREQLDGAPAVIELPADRPRPAQQSFRGATEAVELSREGSEGIRRVSREEGATLYMGLMAAFKVLLHKLGAGEDIVVGTPIAGRSRAEVEKLIGFFVNTLVMRTNLGGNPSYREALRREKEVALEAYAHQEVPFEKVVEAVGPERELSHTPLFQVVFAMQNMPEMGLELEGLKLLAVDRETKTAKFDLTLNLWESGDQIAGVMEYNTDIYEVGTIRRMIEQLGVMVEAIAADPDLPISRLALLTEAETRQQLFEWNDTQKDYGDSLSLHELFERQVERTPESTALIFDTQRLTYRELNSRANQLAHYLMRREVGPEALVGICAERSIDLVIGLLAILKAGAAYVPLDSSYPEQRLTYMVEDARVRALVIDDRHLGHFLERVPEIICFDRDRQAVGRESSLNPRNRTTGDNLAYVIYTSGSTGNPKGAMNTHSGIANRLLWMQEAYGLTQDDRVLQKTPFSFDVSVWEFFWPLIMGAQLVVAAPGGHQDSRYLVDVIASERITTAHFVPSMLQVFLQEEGLERCESLKRVISSGEALSYELMERFYSKLSATLHNLYGPTEAAVDVTYWECERQHERRLVPIGKPINNTQVYVLDKELQPVPIGVAGQIYIGGRGLARGYWDRADLTAQKFIPNPFSSQAGDRLYATGDVGRYLEDSSIDYIGRIDNQVKLRGFRVELGEIEAVINQHTGVEETAVSVYEYARGDSRLIAYVVPDQQRAHSIKQLLRFEREERYPDYARFELPNGMVIFHLNKSETEFLYKEIFEEQSYLRNGITLSDGDCIFDVGANIGLFTLFAGQLCKDAVIYAFEPLPAPFEILQANSDLYGLNVKLFDCGLGAEAASGVFTYYPHCSILSGRFADEMKDREVARSFLLNTEQRTTGGETAQRGRLVDELLEERLKGETVVCPVRTISQVIREGGIDRIDLLKIDVEKSELEVLAGIAEGDWEKIKQIVVEVHDTESRLNKVMSLLESNGYQLSVEQGLSLLETGLYSIYAVRRSETQGRHTAAVLTPTEEMARRWFNASSLAEDIEKFTRKRLPSYMVPSALLMLDQLPLTPNGKLDRRSLPAPHQTHRKKTESIPPRTPTEEVLAGIWAGVLNIEKVGARDDFFQSGGHSLLAIQVIFRIRKVFQVDIPLRSFFESPTVEKMAQFIIEHEAKPGQSERIARVYKKLGSMSDEEKQKALQAKRLERGGGDGAQKNSRPN